MPYLVYINQQLIDVPVDMVLALTVNGVDPSDITSRSSNPTNELSFDKTPKNQEVLGIASNISSSSTVIYEAVRVDIIDNGVPLVINGVGQIEEFDARYKMTVYAGVADAFDLISDKALDKLSFSDAFINADNTYQTTTANRKKDANTIAYFPDINFNAPAGYNLPTYSYDKIIEKIFSDAGYSIDGTFKTNKLYSNLLVPYGRDTLSYGGLFLADRTFKTTRITNQASITGGVINTRASFDHVALQPNTPEFLTATAFDTSGTLFALVTAPADDRYFTGSIEIYIPYLVTAGTGTSFKVQIRAITSTGDQPVWDSGYIYGASTAGIIARKVDTPMKGCYISIQRLTGGTSGFIVESGAYMKLTPDNQVLSTNFLKFRLREFLPDYKQIDLVKDFIARFALIMKTQGKKILFKSITEIIADKSSAVDWTNKLDRTDEPVTKYKPDGWAKLNYFKYSSSDDFDGDKLGVGIIQIDNALLPAKQDYYTSDFVGSVEESAAGSHFFGRAVIPCWSVPPADYSVAFDNAPGIRLLYKFRQPGVSSSYPDTGTFNKNEFDASVDALSFQYALDTYYGRFISALHKFKLVTKFYKLNVEDVVKYDPFKLIYDSGSYYLLVEAPSYEIGTTQSTKVTLLKVS